MFFVVTVKIFSLADLCQNTKTNILYLSTYNIVKNSSVIYVKHLIFYHSCKTAFTVHIVLKIGSQHDILFIFRSNFQMYELNVHVCYSEHCKMKNH